MRTNLVALAVLVLSVMWPAIERPLNRGVGVRAGLGPRRSRSLMRQLWPPRGRAWRQGIAGAGLKCKDEGVKRAPITTPAEKFGPTAIYGTCEAEVCASTARATCAVCDGHFCLGHAAHEQHDGEQSEAAKS
jgi:hypothetical protein